MIKLFQSYSELLIKHLAGLNLDQLDHFRNLILEATYRDNTIYIFGNGGSGASASHIAGDFLKSLNMDKRENLRIHCLNDNYPAIGAISNDLCYEDTFVFQLQALLRPNDLVIGLSGSGNSENVIRAIKFANENQAITMACVGFDGGVVKTLAQHCIHVPVQDMEISEDIHMMIFHMIKRALMNSQNQ